MPIIATDLQYRLSGGAANATPSSSIGGIVSSTSVVDATLHNLFDQVSGAESAAGSVEYRCVYVKNNHATLTLQGAKVWIVSNTPSTSTSIDIGLGSSAVSATEQTIANSTTAPISVTFSAPATTGTALAIGDLAPGATKAVWIRRTVTAGASAYNSDTVTLRLEGDTAA